MTSNKIKDQSDINKLIVEWKNDDKIIVFTNGCFDLLHPGHVDYLEKAKAKGDKLIVGLNTDDSVRRIKGEERPINDQSFRAILLSAMACVDAVVFFDEPTPLSLIRLVKPDILVKGSDYKISNIIGAEDVIQSGGSVVTIPFLEGYSTTRIIKNKK